MPKRTTARLIFGWLSSWVTNFVLQDHCASVNRKKLKPWLEWLRGWQCTRKDLKLRKAVNMQFTDWHSPLSSVWPHLFYPGTYRLGQERKMLWINVTGFWFSEFVCYGHFHFCVCKFLHKIRIGSGLPAPLPFLLPPISECENFDPFLHWNLILWYSKHIQSHCEGSQKCIFHVHNASAILLFNEFVTEQQQTVRKIWGF